VQLVVELLASIEGQPALGRRNIANNPGDRLAQRLSFRRVADGVGGGADGISDVHNAPQTG
jgi:hypothetical protein